MIVITSSANMSNEDEPDPAPAADPVAAPPAASAAPAENKPEDDANKPDENNDDESNDKNNDKKKSKKKGCPNKKLHTSAGTTDHGKLSHDHAALLVFVLPSR